MIKYLIIIEPAETGYSAYSPDLPGCVTSGHTRRAAEERMREAIELHLDGLRAAALPIPEPGSTAAYVEVAA